MEIFKPSNKIIDLYQLVACLIGFVFYFVLCYIKKTRTPNTYLFYSGRRSPNLLIIFILVFPNYL